MHIKRFTKEIVLDIILFPNIVKCNSVW